MRISTPLVVLLICAASSSLAKAEIYCERTGEPPNCVVRPAPEVLRPEVGAPGRLITPGPGPGTPGVGVAPEVLRPEVGAPGAEVAPGAGAGAPGVGVVPDDVDRRRFNRGGPVDRPGRR